MDKWDVINQVRTNREISYRRESTMEKPNRKAMMKSLAISILINGVLPFIIYTLLTTYTHVSDLVALLATGVPSL